MRIDLALYGLSAIFAGVYAATTGLPAHHQWAIIAVYGYGAAFLLALIPKIPRLPLAIVTWVATCLLPLGWEVYQRASGRTDRAQEEVLVIEDAGRRLMETGTPYLSRSAIAGLHEPLLGYFPYQPLMAVFGIPRHFLGDVWYADARVWFALVTVAGLVGALALLPAAHRLRAVQFALVFPISALTLATGGDDLPVLALCLLAFALAIGPAAAHRGGFWAGVAIGLAASLKLFALPVLLVLAVMFHWRPRFLVPALLLPIATAIPALLLDRAAFVENVISFPLGRGLVSSPAASPLPGYLLANHVSHDRIVALVLLGLAAALIIIWMILWVPKEPSDAALVAGVGLLLAILLLPATRFGYLLYPVAFLGWVGALRSPDPFART